MANNENNNQNINSTNELVVRREKLAALVDAGKNPFEITKYDVTYTSVNAISEFEARENELKEGEECTEDEINEFCLALPKYKRPRKLIFAKVPRNPTGKIEKPKLREIYCGGSLVEAQISG